MCGDGVCVCVFVRVRCVVTALSVMHSLLCVNSQTMVLLRMRGRYITSSAMRLLRGGVLVALCSVLTTGAPFSSSFYGDTGCGVSGWPVPEPPGGAKLSQVHAIIRSP